MKKSFLSFLFLALIQFAPAQNSTVTAIPEKDKSKIISWIKQNALPLKSVKAESGFEDLAPMKTVLKDVQIVGLGEATHGTKEFFQMKHRMLEFLVKEMGFTVLALEFNYIGSDKINDYILYGKGDAYTALFSQGLAVWKTEEIIDLIEWMRSYNKTVNDDKKVKVRGLDIRVNYVGDNFEIIEDYLKKVDIKYGNQSDSLLKLVKNMDSESIKGINTDSCKNEFLKLLAVFSINRGDYIQNSSKAEYENISQRLRVIGQYLCMNYITGDDPRSLYNEKTRLRDYYMASNFQDLVQEEKPDTKFIIWAHNMHVSKTEPLDSGDIKMLGNYLKEAYGDKYFAFGFSFDKGSFQSFGYSDEMKSLGMQEFNVNAEHENTVDWYLSQTGLNPFIINFRIKEFPDFMKEFLNARLLTRTIGGQVVKSHVEMMNNFIVIDKCYDALIFINNTTRATPIVSKILN
jgi:erythromycin esterase